MRSPIAHVPPLEHQYLAIAVPGLKQADHFRRGPSHKRAGQPQSVSDRRKVFAALLLADPFLDRQVIGKVVDALGLEPRTR